MPSKLLIVIPAYNEKDNLSYVINDIKQYCPSHDYLIVNDGSTDGTAEFCLENGYSFLDLPINLGLAGAFQAGMIYAYINGYSGVMQFDGDGQHKAEYIESLVDRWQEGFDIVIGSRFLKEKKPFNLRMIGSHLITFAIRLTTKTAICDPTSGMRIFSRGIIEKYAKEINFTPEPDTLAYLLRSGAKVSEVAITVDERKSGRSYLTLIRSIIYMVQITFSILLIQWFRKKEVIRKGNND